MNFVVVINSFKYCLISSEMGEFGERENFIE